jgi:alkylhydroperoxidase family enzyme
MLISTVEKEALSPYMRKIADDLYPRVDPLFMPHFERYMGLLGNAPEHAERFFPYYFGIWFDNKLGARITELARLAIANGTQCQLCLAVRYTAEVNEADVAALPGIDASTLTPAERAVVRFATHFGNDHHKVTAEHFEDLKRHFSDEQITELLLWSAMALGLGRILKVAQLVDETCPLPARDAAARAETIAAA